MNIAELMNSGANVTFAISGADLKEFSLALIAEAKALESCKPEEEKYLTTDEVCDILHVSSNTLWRWGKSGYLIPCKIGRTPMYKLSDINKLREGKGE